MLLRIARKRASYEWPPHVCQHAIARRAFVPVTWRHRPNGRQLYFVVVRVLRMLVIRYYPIGRPANMESTNRTAADIFTSTFSRAERHCCWAVRGLPSLKPVDYNTRMMDWLKEDGVLQQHVLRGLRELSILTGELQCFRLPGSSIGIWTMSISRVLVPSTCVVVIPH